MHKRHTKFGWLREHHLLLPGLLVFIVLIGLGFIMAQPSPRGEVLIQPEPSTTAVEPVGLESRMLLVGDIYWGRAVNRWAQASELKEKYPFSRLDSLNRDQYDAWIGNLECPTVPGVDQPFSVEANALIFNCPTLYLPEFAKWFTVVSLANNHTANQNGQSGLDATRAQLEENGIQYSGHYDPGVLDDVCEVVSLPARLQLNDGTEQVKSLPVALCGYHGLAEVPSDESIELMQRYADRMPVIAYPHMGAEYQATADSVRTRLYRSMIDNGADLVVGGHPHWVQPVEVYNGKVIAYSLGNFMFDQQRGETTRGAALDLSLKLADGEIDQDNLAAWLRLGEQCQVFKDDCWARVEAESLEKLPFIFEYDTPIAIDMNNQITERGDAAMQADTLERLQWTEALRLLGQE